MSSTLAKAAVLLACLGLFACSDPEDGGPGGSGGTGGTGGTGGSDALPVCGNGIREADEECDDGNNNPRDACLNDCTIARCGDGQVLEVGGEPEECDGGVANSDTIPDQCRTDCTAPSCGDGVVDSDEECDVGDDNSEESGACRPEGLTTERGDWSCMKATCGDGIEDPGEACDDGNLDEYDGCTTECTVPVCGNGVIEPGEACDDGTTDGLGGCNPSCQFATCGDGHLDPRPGSGEECDPAPDAPLEEQQDCTVHCKINVCGDGIPHATKEQCDTTEPGCNNCMHFTCGDGIVDNVASDEQCDDRQGGVKDDGSGAPEIYTDWCVMCDLAYCGDGYVHAGVEECDPRDETPGAPDCRWIRFSAEPTDYDRFLSCTIPRCGDGIVDFGDECDDGSLTLTETAAFLDNTDGCLDTCVQATCGDGYVQAGVEECDDGPGNSATAADACRPTGHTSARGDWSCMEAACGDGVVDAGEECDDGNVDDTDGCTSLCMIPRCGNGVIEDGEVCDDGPLNSDTAPSACRENCQPASCGDGVEDTGEECDDGAANSATAANACRPEGHTNARGDWACKEATCGDGVTDAGEDCDDGNLVETDGCTNACTIPVCGNSVVEPGEACDDGDNGADACVDCKPALAPFVFNGFTALEATMRGEVSIEAALNDANKALFDKTAPLRWRITILKGATPAAGVQAFYAGASTSTNHLDWTESIVTDADGVAFFGPETGFTATDAGLDLAGGSTLAFSAVFPEGGSHSVKLELLNIATPATPVLVGTGTVSPNVAAKRLTFTFAGINSLLEGVAANSSFTARLVAAANPTGVLSWRVGLSQAGQPVPGETIAGLTTDANGQVTLADVPTVAQLKAGSGRTVQIPLSIGTAGTYSLRVELRSVTTGLVGFAETPLAVGYEPVESEFDFTDFGSRIRKRATFTAELDGRYTTTDDLGAQLDGQWRVTVRNGTTPVEGTKFFIAQSGEDPADHTTWTGSETTNATGQTFLGGTFPLANVKVTGGVEYAYSVMFPTAGPMTLQFELVTSSGTIVDTETVDVTVAPGLIIGGFNLSQAVQSRHEITFNAQLHDSLDANAPIQWKLTLSDTNGGVDGAQFFYFVTGNNLNHWTWPSSVTTAGGGVALYGPEGAVPFTSSTTALQFGGDTTRLSALFGAAGTYTLALELVNVTDNSVIGNMSFTFPIAP